MSLGGGLFGLNQAMSQPARLSQGQQGLFGGMQQALTPNINVQDPESLTAAASRAADAGKINESQRLVAMAEKIKQEREAEVVKQINATYREMRRIGRAEEYEKAMIRAGRVDEIGAAKAAAINDELMEIKYGNARRAQEAQELTQAVAAAETPEGREAALDAMDDAGFAVEADEIRAKFAEAELDTQKQQLEIAKQEAEQLKEKVSRYPVYSTPEKIEAFRSRLPEAERGLYDQQVTAILKERAELAEAQNSLREQRPLDQKFVEAAGVDYKLYIGGFNAAPNKAKFNQNIIDSWSKGKKRESMDLPTGPEIEVLRGAFDSLNTIERWGWIPDGSVVDETRRDEIIIAAYQKAQQDGADVIETMRTMIEESRAEEDMTEEERLAKELEAI